MCGAHEWFFVPLVPKFKHHSVFYSPPPGMLQGFSIMYVPWLNRPLMMSMSSFMHAKAAVIDDHCEWLVTNQSTNEPRKPNPGLLVRMSYSLP